jgi:hypothetical protein
MSDEIHDTSRVDAWVLSRQRVAFLSAFWRPMLAGAAGAGLMIGAVAVALPKFTLREVVVPSVVMRSVEVPVVNVVPHDVEVDHVIQRPTVIEVPRIVMSPAERRLAESKTFADAPLHGRIVPSRNGALSFDDGTDYTPTLPGMASDSAPFVGDLGFCERIVGDEAHFHCRALHEGQIVPVPQKQIETGSRL